MTQQVLPPPERTRTIRTGRPLSALIEALQAKPGISWRTEDLEVLREWLLSEKRSSLSLQTSRNLSRFSAHDAAEALDSFLHQGIDTAIHRYEPDCGGLWPFLLGCLANFCRNYARSLRKKRLPQLEPLPQDGLERLRDLSPDADPEASSIAIELEVLVARLIAQLKPEYQEVLRRRIEGAAYQQIAAELGISLAMVKIRLCRARQQLRKELRPLWPGGGL